MIAVIRFQKDFELQNKHKIFEVFVMMRSSPYLIRPIFKNLHSPSAFTANGTRQLTISRQLLVLLRWEALCCKNQGSKEVHSYNKKCVFVFFIKVNFDSI